jgi:hypothetical protein
MWYGSLQSSFEREFQRYLDFRGCEGVPSLVAVVKRDGMIRGLLLSYIDGENLSQAKITSEAELHGLTYRIISVATQLEKIGYYNEDLKCNNIMRQRSDGAIYFIDFAGGLTEGFYPEESEYDLCCGKVDPKDALYILGKTLWQLWINDIPTNVLPDGIPDPPRSIIYDCCVARKFNSIAEMQQAWYPTR